MWLLGRLLEKVDLMDSEYFLGAFGNVKVGWMRNNPKTKTAIKTMKKGEIIESKHVDHISNEKEILEKLQHPFIVNHFESTKNNLF
jgi:serine/threonine protein kinase